MSKIIIVLICSFSYLYVFPSTLYYLNNSVTINNILSLSTNNHLIPVLTSLIISTTIAISVFYYIKNKDYIAHYSYKTVFLNIVNNIKQNFTNYLLKYLLILFISIFLGVLFISISFNIDTKKIIKNVETSSYIFSQEGTYHSVFDWRHSKLDNFTDGYILLNASPEVEANIFDKSFLVYHNTIENLNPNDVLVEHYINGSPFDNIDTYSRYWHGYLTIIRPLLLFFNYQQIRIINLIVQTILLLMLLYKMHAVGLRKYIIPFISCILILSPVVTAKSLQYSSCYYIIIIFSLILIESMHKGKKGIWIIFLTSGICTAYFDFLTYPIAIPCTLLSFYLIMSRFENDSVLSNIFVLLVFWCIGYSTMWASKWIISTIFTNQNILLDAANSLEQRTSSTETGSIKTLMYNFRDFFKTPETLLLLFILISNSIKIKNNKHLSKKNYDYIELPFVFVELLPIVWYVLTQNHSSIHHLFTCRSLFGLVIPLLFSRIYLNERYLKNEK